MILLNKIVLNFKRPRVTIVKSIPIGKLHFSLKVRLILDIQNY